MTSRDAQTLLDYDTRSKPLSDDCHFCGTSRYSLRCFHNYRGCSVCNPNNGEWGKPIEPRVSIWSERETTRRWIAEKDNSYWGGFSQFCKDCLIDEAKYRKEAL